jgi:hypothetical protein
MALVVETGTANPAAEAYASVSDADAYFAARGMTLWAPLTPPDKEQALRRSTDYMQQYYRGKWRGYRATSTQALDWPRIDVAILDVKNAQGYQTYYDVTDMPAAVKEACITLSLKAAAGELNPAVGRTVIEERIGPIMQRYEKGGRTTVRYLAVDMMLAALLRSTSFSVTTARA